MVRYLFVIIVFVCFSCKGEKRDAVHPLEMDSTKVEIAPVVKKREAVFKDSIEFDRPINEFIEFSKLIEEDGWIDEIERIQKVVGYGLNKKDIVYFEDKPFFKMNFNQTELYSIYNSNHLNDYVKNSFDELNYHLYKDIRVWAYFYRNVENDNLIEDGVVEQWDFKNESEAESALNQIKKLGGRVLYFNTRPYFTRIRNHLFIFHTRAMAFSYNQEEVFEKFLLENNLKTKLVAYNEESDNLFIQKLKKFNLDSLYEISNKLTPNYLNADFDGDGLEDVVLLIKEKQSDKIGLVFFHSNNTYHIVGAGINYDDELDNMNWLDILELDYDKIKYETLFDKKTLEIIGDRKVTVPHTGVRIREEEGSGGLLYFKDGKYNYLHQGC